MSFPPKIGFEITDVETGVRYKVVTVQGCAIRKPSIAEFLRLRRGVGASLTFATGNKNRRPLGFLSPVSDSKVTVNLYCALQGESGMQQREPDMRALARLQADYFP